MHSYYLKDLICRFSFVHLLDSRPAFTILDNDTQVDKKTVFSENSTIIIRCKFGSNPEPQVMWYIESEQNVPLDQQEILTSRLMNSPMDDDIERAANSSSLVIPRARCEDTNTYLCVSNNSGVAETKGRFKIEILCECCREFVCMCG